MQILNNWITTKVSKRWLCNERGEKQIRACRGEHPVLLPIATASCRQPQAMPASAGVFVMRDRACTGLRISSSSIWYTRRWRLIEVRPSKRGDTSSRLKWVSPL